MVILDVVVALYTWNNIMVDFCCLQKWKVMKIRQRKRRSKN